MKKILHKKKFSKKFWKYLGILSVLALVAAGAIFGINTFQEKEEVAAHPTSEIVLDENGPNEYTVPMDATRLTENRLINDTSFSGYKQNDGYLLNSSKVNVKGLSTVHPAQSISYSEKTDNGGVLAAGMVNTWNTGVSYIFSTTYFLLLDENNNLLDSVQLDGTSLNQTSGGYGTEITALKKVSARTYVMLAQTNTVTITLNNAETAIASVVRGSLNFANNSAPTDMIYNAVQIGLDDKIYYSGHWYQSAENDYFLNNGRLVAVLNDVGIEEKRIRLKYIPCSTIFSNPNYMNIQNISGVTRSSSNQELIGVVAYAPLNGWQQSRIVTWDANGNMMGDYVPSGIHSEIKPLNKISSTDEMYYQVKTESITEIIKYVASSGQFEQVIEFPVDTDLEIIRETDGSYNTIGYLPSVSGVFAPFQNSLSSDSTFVANFSADFEINSAVSMVTGLNRPLTVDTAAFLDNSRYFFSARFRESDVSSIPATDFIDSIEATLGTSAAWTTKSPGADRAEHNIFGILEMMPDHKPAIYAPENIIYNVEDTDLDNPSSVNSQYNWTVRDNWLITGAKGGALTDPTSIKVFDVYDTELSLNPQPNSWHYGRLNRNPLSISDAMEWSALGLDESRSGPQLLSYFVTDTQNQVSTRSRWINKTTDQTVIEEDDKYALDAQNFHVPLADIGKTIPDVDTFKKLAKTMAWDLINHGATDGDNGNGLDEDGANGKFSDKVTVDTAQLKDLQNATEAKPYPVDVVYETNGVKIVNRVWVFATVKNTIPNSETDPAITPKDTNGVVYYGDDYSLPYRLRGTQDKNEILTTGNVRFYNYYDAANENSAELPTLADVTKNANEITTNPSIIQNASSPGVVRPSFSYIWNGDTDAHHTNGVVTIGNIDVTLTGHALLHIRQVVLDDFNEIVVPTEGYFDIQKVLLSGGSPTIDPSYQANLVGKSGKLADNPAFTDISIDADQLPDLTDQFELKNIVPEFYEYLGHYCTNERSDSQGATHLNNTNYTVGQVKLSKGTLYSDEEFWITLYIKPNKDAENNTKNPQPYSWDYEKNNLGEIKAK